MKKSIPFLFLLISNSMVFAQQMPPNTFAATQDPLVIPQTELTIEEKKQAQIQAIGQAQFSSDDVRYLKGLLLRQAQEVATPYNTVAAPVTRSLAITLNPGEHPPVLRLNAGMLSTIVFSDLAGNPWDIEKVSFDSDRFSNGSDNQEEKGSTNILTITPLTAQAYGNLIVTLRGLSTPVIMMLTTGQSETDIRVDAKLPGRSNNAKLVVSSSADSIFPENDSLAFMDGFAPEGAIELDVDNKNVRAWKYNDNTYVRSSYTLIRPAYISTLKANNGMNIYRFKGDINLKYLTFSVSGQPQTVFLDNSQ